MLLERPEKILPQEQSGKNPSPPMPVWKIKKSKILGILKIWIGSCVRLCGEQNPNKRKYLPGNELSFFYINIKFMVIRNVLTAIAMLSGSSVLCAGVSWTDKYRQGHCVIRVDLLVVEYIIYFSGESRDDRASKLCTGSPKIHPPLSLPWRIDVTCLQSQIYKLCWEFPLLS